MLTIRGRMEIEMTKIKKIVVPLMVAMAAAAAVSLLLRAKKEKSPAPVAGGTFICLIFKLISAVNRLSEALNNFSRGIFIAATEIVTGALIRTGKEIKAEK